jgi:SAM-dependent methyltransferase
MAPASEGVRARRGFIADLIDRLAEESHKPHILSIAAGHLREASLCAAVKRRRIGRFVALDGDELSLQEVQRCYSCFGVETVGANIRRLLGKRVSFRDFDLVYSTGLFDYLQQSTGRRLVSNMFQMLRPGGRLVVANFLPGVRDVGYMEAYMDWNLVYRTRRDMIDLTMEIPESDICNATLFSEENRNIILLEVTKD